MAVYIALLRAVNVGGTGKLPMSELRTLCEKAGFEDVVTYIQSGNVVFRSALPPAGVQESLESLLSKRMGKPPGVLIRTPARMKRILEGNPFPQAPPNRVLVFFLETSVSKRAVDAVDPPGREELVASGKEIYVHYPDGQGRSKLKVPYADRGTGRNLNTVRKLLELARR